MAHLADVMIQEFLYIGATTDKKYLRLYIEGEELEEITDRYRKSKGFATMFDDDATDLDGWYDFDIFINENGIRNNEFIAIPRYAKSGDDGKEYYIPLTNNEAKELFESIKLDIEDTFNIDIKEFIEEAIWRCE